MESDVGGGSEADELCAVTIARAASGNWLLARTGLDAVSALAIPALAGFFFLRAGGRRGSASLAVAGVEGGPAGMISLLGARTEGGELAAALIAGFAAALEEPPGSAAGETAVTGSRLGAGGDDSLPAAFDVGTLSSATVREAGDSAARGSFLGVGSADGRVTAALGSGCEAALTAGRAGGCGNWCTRMRLVVRRRPPLLRCKLAAVMGVAPFVTGAGGRRGGGAGAGGGRGTGGRIHGRNRHDGGQRGAGTSLILPRCLECISGG
jgi:hypothetical protein